MISTITITTITTTNAWTLTSSIGQNAQILRKGIGQIDSRLSAGDARDDDVIIVGLPPKTRRSRRLLAHGRLQIGQRPSGPVLDLREVSKVSAGVGDVGFHLFGESLGLMWRECDEGWTGCVVSAVGNDEDGSRRTNERTMNDSPKWPRWDIPSWRSLGPPCSPCCTGPR